MATVAYKRVSTTEQNTSRQLDGMTFDKVFEEKCSASTVNRPQWIACLDYLRDGDSLVVHSLDRVCRSGAGDVVAIVEQLNAMNVSIEFVKEGLKFTGSMSAAQKGVLGILASVAQMERELIRERQSEGIAAAKAKGKKFGRPTTGVSLEQFKVILEECNGNMTAAAKQAGIGRASAYRLMKEEK